MGKTRLATEVLARAGSSFPDGTTFVDLSAVRDPAVVLPRVATALGVVEGVHSAGLADRLAAHLAGRRVLVVLDNVEQVLAAAPAVADLLARAPGLTVVATSRAPLRVRAEREVPVGPLALPEDDDPASVSASPAVSVFLDRAAATGVQWAVTPETAATLAGIARRLDGLPLALELAAAGARVLPPEALLARLEQRGLDPGLGHGPRDLPDRQRTMTTVLDWSADLLEPEEWDLLMRLSVFSGGFSLDSVEAVVGGSGGAQGSDDVLPALTSLVEQSLVVPVARTGPRSRASGCSSRCGSTPPCRRRRRASPSRRPRRTPRTSASWPSRPTVGCCPAGSAPSSTASRPTTPTCARPTSACSSSTVTPTPPSSSSPCGCTSACGGTRARAWGGSTASTVPARTPRSYAPRSPAWG